MMIKYLNEDKYLKWYEGNLPDIEFIGGKNLVANHACSFDIETSLFEENGEKISTMYMWAFSIFPLIFIGRTYDEFVELLNRIIDYYNLDSKKKICVYVHNLSYEFQFIRKWLQWDKVFARDNTTILYCEFKGIIFKCSYQLTGYSLENLAGQLKKYNVKKLMGDLDYSLIRGVETHITNKEIRYLLNDVRIIVAYLTELKENGENIGKLPLTKTSFVRRDIKAYIFDNKFRGSKYRKLMSQLILNDEVYRLLKKSFSGGFVHGNVFYQNEIIKNVDSLDRTSAYPCEMLTQKFPMSSPRKIVIKTDSEFKFFIQNYNCVFEINFKKIYSTFLEENYISASKCSDVINSIENNGRIASADNLTLVVTEIDYFLIKKLYKWEEMYIGDFYYFEKGYLPSDFIISMLNYYKNKTMLKNVNGREYDYMLSKNNLNSFFGMTVTDIVRDEWVYKNDEFNINKVDVQQALNKYNNNKFRYLYYPWGVWVTAYARLNLLSVIYNIKEDYIYSDTDCVKFKNSVKYIDFFNMLNNAIKDSIKKAMFHHGFDINLAAPVNEKGEQFWLGVWEKENLNSEYTYSRFRFLNSKRYAADLEYKYKYKLNGKTYETNHILTASGVKKYSAINYLDNIYKDKFLENFNTDLILPADKCGKLVYYYIKDEKKGILKDYQGNYNKYYEKSAVYLANSSYSFGISEKFVNYLKSLRGY